MSSPFATAAASPAVPPTKEFTAAWIAYLCMVLSAFLLWPAVISLIISYSKRGNPATGFIGSHHRWMIRSFWWSQLWFLVFFVVMMIGIWPFIMDIARQVIDAGDSGYYGLNININWGQVFGTVGAAMIGGLGMALTWIWFLYRMARGMIVLGDARALP